MKEVLGKYKPYVPMMLLVVMFLFGQAMSELMLPSYMSDIINNGVVKGDIPYIYSLGLRMVLVSFLAVACAITGNLIAARVAAGSARDIRSSLFRRVMTYSAKEYSQFSTASLITRSTNDVQNLQQTTVFLLRMAVFAPVMGTGALIKALSLSPGMTWTLALGLIVILLLMITLFFAVLPKFKVLQDKLDRLNLIISERLSGLLVVRAFSSEQQEEDRFDDANMDLTRINIFINRAMAFMFPSVTLIMNATCTLIIWAGAKMVAKGGMNVGEVMAFMQYGTHVILSFLFITAIFIMIPRAAVSAKRINDVLAMETTITDAEDAEAPVPEGKIEFRNVCFRYPDSAGDSLTDISFTALPGQTTAIIGGTGSGKSSLVSLIPRFYDIREGSIKIDGQEIRKIPLKDLRAMIGYVPQKSTLFNGTVADNIAFSDPGASMDRIRKAAETAQAAGFIEELPDGYSTWIAQGGSTVSGGQKQRLAIARALLKNAKIYIFDDSFSALDFSTDAALRAALAEDVSDATVIIVAQRINTIAGADQIIVLDEGRLAGIGIHSELLDSCKVYREIAMSQLSEEELAEQFGGRFAQATDGKEAE